MFLSAEALESQFALASLAITLAALVALALVFAQGQRGWVWLAAALLLAWAGGYHYATSESLRIFLPDDSKQILYSGAFVGDGASPASSAVWLRYAVASACVMAMAALWLPGATLLPVLAGGVWLPILLSWQWAESGRLGNAGFFSQAGAMQLLLIAGSTILAVRMERHRRLGPPEEEETPAATWHRVWYGLLGLLLVMPIQSARGIDMMWIAMTASHLLVASAAGAIVAMMAARRFAVHPAAYGAAAGLAILASDPVNSTPLIAAATGAAGSALAMAGAHILRRYGRSGAQAVSLLLLTPAAGCLLVAATNPTASLYVQAAGIISIFLATMAAGVATSVALRKIRRVLPQRLR